MRCGKDDVATKQVRLIDALMKAAPDEIPESKSSIIRGEYAEVIRRRLAEANAQAQVNQALTGQMKRKRQKPSAKVPGPTLR